MKSLIPLIVTTWLPIPNEEAPQQRNLQNKFNPNPLNIGLHTGMPNRINTHKVPRINTGYPPHHPNTKIKQNHTNAN